MSLIIVKSIRFGDTVIICGTRIRWFRVKIRNETLSFT